LLVSFVLHQREVLRLVVDFRGLVVDLRAGGFTVEVFCGAGFAVSADFAVLLATTESRFMTESPASGGASGCLKYTGSRIDTGTGCPIVFAGSNFRSRDPFMAAESSAVKPDVSAMRVESATVDPLLSMKIRNVTFP
jgi:hypothetical protein